MKIKEINTTILKELRHETNNELARLGNEYGVKFEAGGASYTIDSATFKLTMKVRELSKTAKAEKDETNEMLSQMYGFKENIVGRTFTHKGEQLTIIAIDPKKPKYPVIVARRTGQYKMTVDAVKILLTQ